MVYRLGFKASNEAAQKFQALLADEVLPALRKTGTYTIPKDKSPNLKQQEVVDTFLLTKFVATKYNKIVATG